MSAPMAETTKHAARPTFTTAVLAALAHLSAERDLSEKELADRLRLGATQWSKQKRGKDGHGMRVQRFDALPEAELACFLDGLSDALDRQRRVARGQRASAPPLPVLLGLLDVSGMTDAEQAAVWTLIRYVKRTNPDQL
jgi:hypothetical protein